MSSLRSSTYKVFYRVDWKQFRPKRIERNNGEIIFERNARSLETTFSKDTPALQADPDLIPNQSFESVEVFFFKWIAAKMPYEVVETSRDEIQEQKTNKIIIVEWDWTIYQITNMNSGESRIFWEDRTKRGFGPGDIKEDVTVPKTTRRLQDPSLPWDTLRVQRIRRNDKAENTHWREDEMS